MKYVVCMLALVAALIVAGCGGGGGQPAAQQPAAQQPATPASPSEGQEIEVIMSEFKFEVASLEVRAGKVTFEVKNVGAVEHSFIIEGIGKGTEQIRPGQEAKLAVDLKPGTYAVICDVAGHKEAGMTMQLVVK